MVNFTKYKKRGVLPLYIEREHNGIKFLHPVGGARGNKLVLSQLREFKERERIRMERLKYKFD